MRVEIGALVGFRSADLGQYLFAWSIETATQSNSRRRDPGGYTEASTTARKAQAERTMKTASERLLRWT